MQKDTFYPLTRIPFSMQYCYMQHRRCRPVQRHEIAEESKHAGRQAQHLLLLQRWRRRRLKDKQWRTASQTATLTARINFGVTNLVKISQSTSEL